MSLASRTCAFLLLALISLGQVSLSLNSFWLDVTLDSQDELSYTANHDHTIHFSLDFHTGLEPNLEDSAEKDFKENLKERLFESEQASTPGCLSHFIYTSNPFWELYSHKANRGKVALYILYHNWKGHVATHIA